MAICRSKDHGAVMKKIFIWCFCVPIILLVGFCMGLYDWLCQLPLVWGGIQDAWRAIRAQPETAGQRADAKMPKDMWQEAGSSQIIETPKNFDPSKDKLA